MLFVPVILLIKDTETRQLSSRSWRYPAGIAASFAFFPPISDLISFAQRLLWKRGERGTTVEPQYLVDPLVLARASKPRGSHLYMYQPASRGLFQLIFDLPILVIVLCFPLFLDVCAVQGLPPPFCSMKSVETRGKVLLLGRLAPIDISFHILICSLKKEDTFTDLLIEFHPSVCSCGSLDGQVFAYQTEKQNFLHVQGGCRNSSSPR